MTRPSNTPRRAAIYVRISKDVAGTGLGVARQEGETRELAARIGWDVSEVYVDNDTEASSGKPRPAYVRMVDDMKAGLVDGVLAWHTDRLYRRPDELEDLILVADAHGVQFDTVKAGKMDLSTSAGRLVARLLGAVSKHETELKGERQSAKLRQLAMDGYPTGGGSRPFGWKPGGMVLDPVEGPILRDLALRALSGESILGLAEWLTKEGVPTIGGKGWHPTVVKRMLVKPRIAGLSVWDGEIVGKARWEAAIDEATWRQLVQVLTYKGPERHRGRVALLAGLTWCGRCPYELVTSYVQRRNPRMAVRVYACRTKYLVGRPGHGLSCGKISIKATAIEEDVAEQVLGRLARPREADRRQRAAEVRDGQVGGTMTDLAAAEEFLRQLGRDYADQLMGRTEFYAARERAAQRVKDLQAALDPTPRLSLPYGDPVALAAMWESATLAQRAGIVSNAVARIEVLPHSDRRLRYDYDRVRIEWR